MSRRRTSSPAGRSFKDNLTAEFPKQDKFYFEMSVSLINKFILEKEFILFIIFILIIFIFLSNLSNLLKILLKIFLFNIKHMLY